VFKTSEESMGTEYTTPVALLFVALVFVPLVLFVSRPFENAFALLGLCTSLVCVVLSWSAWKRASALATPSIADAQRERK